MTVRLNTIKVRVDAGTSWQQAVNRAIERVEAAGGRVLQYVDRVNHAVYRESANRKTDDWSVTLLVETTDG